MMVALGKIKVIILVGLTVFIVLGSFNLARIMTQTKRIKNIDKDKIGMMEKVNELQALQNEKNGMESDKQKVQNDEKNDTHGFQAKSNQGIEGEPENKLEEEYIPNSEGTEKRKSVVDEKTETYFLTYNEIKSLEKVSLGDKLFGMMLVSKIKSANLNRIWDLASGGITTTEEAKLKTILEKDLKQKDIEKIYQLLNRNMERLASK